MADNNNPLIAGILSFLIPGLGHALINKNVKKGIVMFLIAIVIGAAGFITLYLASLIWAIFSGYDAYMEAQSKPVWKFA